jgi:hypothetical protein
LSGRLLRSFICGSEEKPLRSQLGYKR